MIIYKDIITGDELFTDCNKVTLVDDCLYEVHCHHVSRKVGEVHIDGANPSAEGDDADEGVDDGPTESGLDLVLNQQLQKTVFDKKSYLAYLKTYSNSLQAAWKDNEMDEATIAEYKKGFSKAVSLIKNKLSDVEFYLGSSMNADGMVALLEYRNKPDGSEDAFMIFYKHGLESEKV